MLQQQMTRLAVTIENNLARFPLASRVVNDVIYRAERLLQQSDALTPPRSLRNQVGPFDSPRLYRDIGRGVLGYFVERCGLERHESVLDLGCGCGQIAAPLTGYLDRSARYEGFDIGDAMIDWCKQNITTRFPNFHFAALDVINTYYRPNGRVRASELVFPYADGTFDFAFAKSLFTHLLPPDAENYVKQMARVLRPGGRAWLSFFLLDDEALKRIAAGQSTLAMQDTSNGYWTVDRSQPEYALARPERDVLAMIERHGLALAAPIERGSWSGRSAVSYQDSIFVTRR